MSLTFTAAVRANKPKRNVGLISAGDLFSLAIQRNGRAWSWGINSSGNLGDNSTTQRLTPVSVLGSIKTFCQISTGYNHSLAIDKNGRAWAWGGGGGNGKIGDNTLTQRCTPVSVAGAVKTFCQISAGYNHSLAIDKNGRAWAWGFNGAGRLGDNSTTQRLTPVSVLGTVKTFCQISAGNAHSLAIDKNGRAWGWGSNYYGNIGDNSGTQRNTPVSVLGAVKTFCRIDANFNSALYYSLAIDKNGRAWGWGFNGGGQLGDNSTTQRLTPVSVLGSIKTFCQISAGYTHSVAIDKNGRAWAWGINTSGQLGDNTIISRLTPVSVLGAVKTFCQISAGNGHSLAIDKNGRAWSWGSNSNGELGINSTAARATPVSVLGTEKTFCAIASGTSFSLAIDKNGRAWGWGLNAGGRLGDNSTTQRNTPVSVLGGVKTFCRITAGNQHSLAIDRNGRAWSWGSNSNGELGINTTTSRLTPVSILGAIKTFCQISGGSNHSLAIDKNGRAWAWGGNNTGQLGDNSTTQRLTPVSVLGTAKTFCQINASRSSQHSLAIDKNGRAWAWGTNSNGNLGDNSTTQRNTPVSVLGAVKTFCQISAGASYSLAIDKNGRAWGWGFNTGGVLGDNSTTQRLTPVSVLGTVKTFCQISAGSNHSLAIDKNGRAWAWGPIAGGRLGINKDTVALTPIQVCNI